MPDMTLLGWFHTVLGVGATKPKARYVVPRAARMMLFLRWLLNDRMFDALWRRFMRVPKSID